MAHAYASYLMETGNAEVDGGTFVEGNPTSKVDGGYESCSDPSDDSTCITWADLRGRDGKLVSFTVSGNAIKERLSAGSGKPVQAGDLGTIEMLYAYKSVASPNLFVVIRARSGDAAMNVGSYEATYRGPTRRQSTASNTLGPTELQADSTANMVLAFAQADVGGSVTLPVYSGDFMTAEEVQFATR